MKTKIIKLSDTHYIGVDDSEIKEGDWIYDSDCPKIVEADYLKVETSKKQGCWYYKKITHSTQPLYLNDFWAIKELKLSEVEEAINGYSVDDGLKYVLSLPNSEYLSYGVQKMLEDAYNKGFNAHKELVKDKLFTEKHMKMLFAYAHSIGMNTVLQIQSPHLLSEQDTDKLRDEFIQSLLPKTEWDVEIDEQGKITIV
jgi:hypothetical protein